MFSNGNFSATLHPVAACQFNFKHSRCSSYFCGVFLVFIRLHCFGHCISSAGRMSKTANISPLPLTEATGNPTKVFWSAIITTPLKFYLTTVLYSQGLFLKEMAHPSSAEPSCKPVQSSLPSLATKMPVPHSRGAGQQLLLVHLPMPSQSPTRTKVQLLLSMGTTVTVSSHTGAAPHHPHISLSW